MFTRKLSYVFQMSRSLLLFALLPSVVPQHLPYITIAEKSVAGYQPTDTTSFSIPHNQCSGFIDESLLCGAGGVAGAVRVVVQEPSSFASVHVHRLLHNVTVLRGRDARGACGGQAEVDVHVGCLVRRGRTQRRRRFIHVLPEANAPDIEIFY